MTLLLADQIAYILSY